MVYNQQQRGYHVFYANEGYDRTSSIYTVSSNVSMIPPSPPEPNVPIRIDTYERDEQIVYSSNYKFTLGIEELIVNSTTSRRATRGKRSEPPRPQNSYILYLRDTTARIKKDPEFIKEPTKRMTKVISKMWKNEIQSVKDVFEALANLARKRHLKNYLGYQYKPRKSMKKKSVNEQTLLSTSIPTPATSVSSSPTLQNLDLNSIFDLDSYYDNSSHDSHVNYVSPLAVHKDPSNAF
ncbi:16242_t:CDS:1 [Funneliformis mosseae]|uniref:16242_t:CDS:1 n=1 Tax=Funneliformis mosseae TaxID=27381 RepID=A0A9N9F3K4_FUNMO|nr:16242_t:CDS:1 [Funneliformis mosseae]